MKFIKKLFAKKYRCNFCNEEYDTLEEAKECEKRQRAIYVMNKPKDKNCNYERQIKLLGILNKIHWELYGTSLGNAHDITKLDDIKKEIEDHSQGIDEATFKSISRKIVNAAKKEGDKRVKLTMEQDRLKEKQEKCCICKKKSSKICIYCNEGVCEKHLLPELHNCKNKKSARSGNVVVYTKDTVTVRNKC
jgi:predicted nucleic acid binding AN1-type Zn finger protein